MGTVHSQIILQKRKFGFPFSLVVKLREYSLNKLNETLHSFFSTKNEGIKRQAQQTTTVPPHPGGGQGREETFFAFHEILCLQGQEWKRVVSLTGEGSMILIHNEGNII